MVSISNPFSDILGIPQELEAATTGDSGHSLVIEELDVPDARRIELKGRAMPYQGANWGGTQRTKKTVYPGNPVASIQVLGPVEEDSTFEGIWKDRFMAGAVEIGAAGGAGNLLGDAVGAVAASVGAGSGTLLAENVVQIFHDIRRSGVMLRVQYLSEVRFGILKEFDARYARAQDIAWTATFEWTAWDDNEVLRSADEPLPSLSVLDDLNALLDAIANAPDLVRAFTARLATAVDRVGTLTQALFSILQTIDALTDLPGAVLGQMLAVAREIERTLSDLIGDILDVRWPNIAGSENLAQPTLDPSNPAARFASSAVQVLTFERWRHVCGAAAVTLRRTCGDAVQQRVAQRLPRTTRTIIMPQGGTLYDLATKYYGSPDFATYLAVANGLSGARVPAGFRLRVPPKPTGPTGLEVRRGRDCKECC